ncbi:hypothetical protein [Nocardia cyriacigeorgica]|uniref:hypothetical protein n=1 Tax=Nocardia cyriacigeorgica TaxID=135487 RepID=UPI0018952A2A|nr:hypothetical protein [Nocardia cyriacigeorgica]MBF6456203.1 hypothetical protein [Nocardia cyriacigeorgica]MBF6477724.1 hypothetical protein [Nocardia cyriacigeorgica]MBF6553057.1 hypothetical protein [Nocardia cyriacigeorgica]
MRVIKHGARLGLAIAAVLTGSLSMAAPANAATPASVCGSGYRVIDTHDLGSLATIYLLYNGRTNCAVTWKTAYIGTKTPVGVELGIWGKPDLVQKDSGWFAYYAGPVKVDAPGTCIGWGGFASRPDATGQAGWRSPGPSHCG